MRARLGLCPDVRIQPAAGGTRLFLTAAGQVMLGQALTDALVPLLDGTRERGEVVRALCPPHDAAAVLYSLTKLERAGMLVPSSALLPLRSISKAPGSHRSAAISEAWARFSPYTSVLAHPPSHVPLPEGLHVCFAPLAQPGELPGFEPLMAVGRGETELHARLGCVAEGIERMAALYTGTEPTVLARLSDLEAAVPPPDLQLFSERQLAEPQGGVPARYEPSTPIEWSEATSLLHARRVHVPTACCYLRYPLPQRSPISPADSSGCAAGLTTEEAVLHGLLELIERDAAAIWWRNRLRRPELPLKELDDMFIERCREALEARGRTLAALDLTTDVGIPAIAAVSWRKQDGRRIVVALGAHPSPHVAARQAAAELLQRSATELTTAPVQPLPGHPFTRWLDEARLEEHPQLMPAGLARWPADSSGADLRDELQLAIGRVAATGHDVLVMELSRDELGPPVVRVLVPGFRSIGRRFAPGRLFDVPVAMGWRSTPCVEGALNPTALVL